MRSKSLSAFGLLIAALAGCSSPTPEPQGAAGPSPTAGASGAGAGGATVTAGTGGTPSAGAPAAGTGGSPAAGSGGTPGGAGGGGGAIEQPPATSFLYVSGYAPPITTFTVDHATGMLSEGPSVSTGEAGEPTFIAFSPDKKFAYAIDEQLDGPLAWVIAYSVDVATGALTEINREDVGTPVNAHAAVHQSGDWVLSANYDGNSVTVFEVRDDGGLEPGMTPVPAGTRAHQIVFDSTGTHLFVPCLEGHIAVYDFADGMLTPRDPATVPVDGGARHIAFSLDEKYLYVLTQNESTITQFAYDAASVTLTPIETISAAPDGGALSAHIAVHQSGKFLYASNRSDNSIATFSIDPSDGRLTNVGYQREMLDFPRFFAIDPTGQWMVVASQNSAEILMHEIDQELGTLSVVGSPISVAAEPTFVGMWALP